MQWVSERGPSLERNLRLLLPGYLNIHYLTCPPPDRLTFHSNLTDLGGSCTMVQSRFNT